MAWGEAGGVGRVDVPLGSECVWADGGGKERRFPGRGPGLGLISLQISNWNVSILVWKKMLKNAVQRCDRCWGILPGPAKRGEHTLESTLCLELRL